MFMIIVISSLLISGYLYAMYKLLEYINSEINNVINNLDSVNDNLNNIIDRVNKNEILLSKLLNPPSTGTKLYTINEADCETESESDINSEIENKNEININDIKNEISDVVNKKYIDSSDEENDDEENDDEESDEEISDQESDNEEIRQPEITKE